MPVILWCRLGLDAVPEGATYPEGSVLTGQRWAPAPGFCSWGLALSGCATVRDSFAPAKPQAPKCRGASCQPPSVPRSSSDLCARRPTGVHSLPQPPAGSALLLASWRGDSVL